MSEQIKITLPDGTVKEYQKGTTGLQIAASISEGLARNVLAAKVNGQVWDATRAIDSDSSLQLLTWNDLEGKNTFWHSSAHLLAEALEDLYPGIKFGIGHELVFHFDREGLAMRLDRHLVRAGEEMPRAVRTSRRRRETRRQETNARCALGVSASGFFGDRVPQT